MTDNDYVAEYIKENYPQLLGLDYGLWKIRRVAGEAVQKMVAVFQNIDWATINEVQTADQNENAKTESEVK